MKIDKKLIVSVLELYKLDIVNREIKEHDQSLELLIKVNEQIKLVKEWKKQIKCSISGYIIVS